MIRDLWPVLVPMLAGVALNVVAWWRMRQKGTRSPAQHGGGGGC